MYLNKKEINKRWVEKYGFHYPKYVSLSCIDEIDYDFCDGGINYYSEDKIIDIEKIFAFDHLCNNVSRINKMQIYKLIYIDGYEIYEVVEELGINEEYIQNFIYLLMTNYNNKILELHFHDFKSIDYIIDYEDLKEDYVINTIVDYLRLFGATTLVETSTYNKSNRLTYKLVYCEKCNFNWLQRTDSWNRAKIHLCKSCSRKKSSHCGANVVIS